MDSLDQYSPWWRIGRLLKANDHTPEPFDWNHPGGWAMVCLTDDDVQAILELAESANFNFPIELGDSLTAKLSNLMLQRV